MSKRICPKSPDHKTFLTTAHVVQEWVVDEHGDFVEMSGGYDEVIHGTDHNNTWTCATCGCNETELRSEAKLGKWAGGGLYTVLEHLVDSEHVWTAEDVENHQIISEAPELDAYRAYIEEGLERISKEGWAPVCFAEFRESEWCANHIGRKDG